jgi:hypothetical protein
MTGLIARRAPSVKFAVLYRKKPGSLRQPGARARDDNDCSFDVIAHDLASYLS